MKGKRFLSVFIAAACLLMSIPTTCLAAENKTVSMKASVSAASGDDELNTYDEPDDVYTDEDIHDDDPGNVTEDGWKYENVAVENDDGTYTDGIGIIGHTDPMPSELVFPSEVNGKPVITVGEMVDDGFKNSPYITSVVIPDSVKTISSDAFYGCDSLKSVDIGDGVKKISSYAFYNCTGLSNIKLGSSVESIGKYAFNYCQSLTVIKLGSSVKEIGQEAFSSCSDLQFIVILNKDCEIYDSSSTIDNMLGYNGFVLGYVGSTAEEYAKKYDCKFLDVSKYDLSELDKLSELPVTFSITTDDNDETMATITGYNEGLSDELVIPSDIMGIPVKKIGYDAFEGCKDLKSVTIPDGVTEIVSGAFSNCTSLTDVVIPESVIEISKDSFENTPWLSAKTAENPLLIINHILIDGTSCTGDVVIPDGVKSIGSLAFENCEGMTSVTLPDGVTSIGYSAFVGCTGLTDISLPDSLEDIEMAAFRNCTGLKSIVIPNNVTGCGSRVFGGCSSLESITLGDSMEGFYVWGSAGHCGGCTSLTNIYVSDGNDYFTSVDGILFSKDKTQLRAFPCNKELTEYTVPTTVTAIGSGAFANSKHLEKVILPESVTEIKAASFLSCEKLKTLIIMNKDCEIPETPSTVCNEGDFYGDGECIYNGVIVGCPDSTAQKYADKYEFKFDDIANYDISSDTPQGTYGDLDGDGKITSADSLLILRQSVSLEHFTDFQQKLADVDGDGKITSADALEVLRYSVSLPTTGNIGKTITN